MFKAIINAVILTACTVQSQTNVEQLHKEIIKRPVAKGVAVLELFTSEGCSSCPSADKLASRLQDSYKDKLIVLEFHVDYWDRLGWKDPFSKAAYTQRQRQYAEKFNLESIYTPQAVINGISEAVGSDEYKLTGFIDRAISSSDDEMLLVTAGENADGKNIKLTWKYTGRNDAVINFALVQKQATTDVRAGENEGRRLAHNNIVTDFVTKDGNSGEVQLAVPNGISKKELRVIAYAQQKPTGSIKTAVMLDSW